METRRLEKSEWEKAKVFFADVFTKAPWFDDWSDEDQLDAYINDLTQNPNSLAFAMFDGEEMVALSMGLIKHWFRGTEYCIEELCVTTARQGQGIGTRFVSDIERLISGMGLKAIFLQTDRDMPAFEFYKKRGFCLLEDHVSFAKDI